MYAIIKKSGKQYRVAKGDIIDIDLQSEAKEGAQIEFNEVLFFNDGENSINVGLPLVSGCIVLGEVISQDISGPKIHSVKYKRSHNQWRKFGHRQHYTRVKINEIQTEKSASKEAAKETKTKGRKSHGA